ncbi:MAG TPA: glycosyltransferase family 9 protein [Ignavibacteria bacterium]|nr:glycosyltransferase family 9 protein [Ignavibacteria bacterium]
MLKHLFRILGRSEKPVNISEIDPGKVKNILIVRQHNQLGDMLCSVPLFAAIRKRFPDAHITLVASPINYEILFSDINPFIDKVITYRKSPFRNLIEFYKELKNHDYQIGIVPSTVSISRTSHFINYFSGAKIRVGVNSIDEKVNSVAYLLNVKSDFEWDTKKLHQTERNLDVGRQIKCDLTDDEKKGVMIHLSDEEIKFAKEYIDKNFPDKTKLLISLHPGAGKVPNRWARENFVELIKRLYEKYDCSILITSGLIDKEITDKVREELISLNINCLVLENTTIRKVGAVIKLTDLYITNDTGTLHVAGGVDANVISLFGPTHGYEWAPIGDNKIYIQSPSDSINDITVDLVFNESVSLLEKTCAKENTHFNNSPAVN